MIQFGKPKAVCKFVLVAILSLAAGRAQGLAETAALRETLQKLVTELAASRTAHDAKTAEALIRPAPEEQIEAFPVSTDVNRVANDNPRLVERADEVGEVTPPAPKRKVAAKRAAPANTGGRQGSLF